MVPNLGRFGLLRMNLNQTTEVYTYIIRFYMILLFYMIRFYMIILVAFSENAIAIVFENNMCVYFYL